MNDIELKQLQRVLEKIKRSKAMAKVAYRDYNNVYQWGLGDGLEMALDMIMPFYNQMFETHTREHRPVE